MASSTSIGSSDPFQSCLNGIGHKLYEAQEAVFGLCSTDSKIYTFLILGRVLQAAALVSFTAATICTFIVGPMSLIATIPAVFAGILGTYIAGDPQGINELLQMARLFVPGQPIGLVNSGNNCWLNSSLQLLANVPGYHTRLREMPVFAQFLNDYARSEQNQQKVSLTIDTHQIRQFLNRETAGQIEQGHYQEDAAQIFECLFQGPNARYSLEQRINGGAPIQRLEPMIQVVPGQQASRPDFQQLFDSYFDHHTDIGQHVQLSFQQPPDDMLIQMKRFYQHVDSAGVLQQGKIIDPINIPERIALPNRFVRSNEAAQYQCDAFVIHRGPNQNDGHYVAFVKRGETWWYCSDSTVYEVPATLALAEMRYSYICHFSKVS